MNTIDTKIRHVTKSDANLFAELDFSAEDAARYHRESCSRIEHTLKLKEQLMEELVSWMKEENLKQTKAAEILHVTRPRISDVVNKKTSKFTIDALVGMLSIIGKPVKFVTMGRLRKQKKSYAKPVAASRTCPHRR